MEEEEEAKKEIGDEAVWIISSAKPGNGVEQIRDDNINTYWKSDGNQPHTIDIQFNERMDITFLDMYLDVKLDESYTPKKLRILYGSSNRDLHELHTVTLDNPVGWISIPLGKLAKQKELTDIEERKKFFGITDITIERKEEILKTFFIRIKLLSMHQGGKDTHIRQVKIYGPDIPSKTVNSSFQSKQFSQYQYVR